MVWNWLEKCILKTQNLTSTLCNMNVQRSASIQSCMPTGSFKLLSLHALPPATFLKKSHTSSPSWGLIKDTRSYCFMIKAQSASKRPLIGVYHFVWGAWCVGLGRGGLDGMGISSSGTITTAFFAFSSLAPSSVDPLSPQRTFKMKETLLSIKSSQSTKLLCCPQSFDSPVRCKKIN